MLRAALIGVVLFVGCGLERPQTSSVCKRAPVDHLGLGVAHVAGRYTVTKSGETLLAAGAHRALELGAPTLKVYLTPDYAQKYPMTWPAGITSLATLADSAPMREVLDLPFQTIVFTTYSFSMGTGDPWRAADVPALLEAEAREFDELIAVLAARPSSTPRTYVFQTWEGDWALLGSYDVHAHVPAERAGRMANWLNRRHQAIDEARTRYAKTDVKFFDAIEVNRVLDADGSVPRVTTDVLPDACSDFVSYSAWEALDVAALAENERAATIDRRLSTALARLREFAPVYLGEVGLAEQAMPNTDVLVTAALDSAARHGAMGSIYWEIFDNECTDAMQCPGYWVMKPDGALSAAGAVLAARWKP